MVSLFKIFKKALTRLYVLLIKSSFASFGKNSVINFPATVNFPKSIAIGQDVWIREHAWLNCAGDDHAQKLSIGDGSYIGRFVHINAYESVVLEDHVLISDRVFISDVHHEFSDDIKPIIKQGVTHPKPILLKSGCWIGIGACIMPGVTIGRNAIVGANAVVTQDIPDGTIALGIPARVKS